MSNGMTKTGVNINANQNRGVLSPYVLGSMYEWESDGMNGTWAEKAIGRNFETDTIKMYNQPLYDHFSREMLDRSRWSPMCFGGTSGTYQVGHSHLRLVGADSGNFGLSTRIIQDAQWNNVTVKATLSKYTGNTFLSVFSGNDNPYRNYIEVGILDGKAVVRHFSEFNKCNEVLYYSEKPVVMPLILKICVGHISDKGRAISFDINGDLFIVSDCIHICDDYRAALYCEEKAEAFWDSIDIFHDTLYDSFSSVRSRFSEYSDNKGSGTLSFESHDLTLFSSGCGSYGVCSQRIRNSAVNWTEISVGINKVDGNGMITLFNDNVDGSFVKFGVADGKYVVWTSSGFGSKVIDKAVKLPSTLHVQVQPYYSNGRNFRFYVDGELVHHITEIKDLTEPDYKISLSSYGVGNSSTWTEVKIRQEHFTDPMGPHFEGNVLPNDIAETNINGDKYGSLEISGGFLNLYGASGSKYGVTMMPFNNSDIKPHKCCAKLTKCEGESGILYITSGNARGDYADYVEFGVEDGRLIVRTETDYWQGCTVELPVILDVYVSEYGKNGRNISFTCNGEPVYYMENFPGLKAKDIKVAVYSGGNTYTQWDYVGGYVYEAWTEDGFDGCASYYLDDSEVISGYYSMCIDIRENNGMIGVSQPAVSIIKGHDYDFSVWMKKVGSIAPIHIQIGPNQPVSPCYEPYGELLIDTVEENYIKYSGKIKPSRTDTNAKLLVLAEGTGKLWLDQISLLPTHESEVAAGGFRRDFVDKLTILNPKNLRWPGGIIADWYRFKNGLGSERDKREPQFFAQWNASWLNNDVGVDEFLKLCEILCIDPSINVNYGTATPLEAHDFVEYVNGSSDTPMGSLRKINGREDPYGIKFWEIGNETWGIWSPGYTDAVTFSYRLLEYIDMMHKADPTIRIIAEGADGNSYLQGWNCAVMGIAGHKLTEISTHYYSPQSLPQDYDDETVYWSSVGSPKSVEERLRLTMNIATVSCKDIKYAITEYNAMYFISPIRRTRTMEAALQVAGLLHAFLRYPGATGHNNCSCLANFWDGSSIHTGQRGVFVIPSYYVLYLLANKRGEIVLETTANSDTYSISEQIGNTPALFGVPYLDVLATRNIDGSKLYISIINRDKDCERVVSVDITGIRYVNTLAVVHTLTSAHFLDTNSFLEPDAVSLQTHTIDCAGTGFSFVVSPMSYTVLELDVDGLSPINTPILCGLVVDSNGSGIKGAVITVNGVVMGTTDERGYYQISKNEGEYIIVASKVGYKTSTMECIYLYGNGVTCQPIRLLSENTLNDGAVVEIMCSASGKLLTLTDMSTDDGVFIIQEATSGLSNQKWIAKEATDGSYYFINVYSGKALSIYENNYFEGSKIVQRQYKEDPDQHWIVELIGQQYRFTSKHNSLCLDLPDNDNYVQTWYDNKKNNQRFSINIIK